MKKYRIIYIVAISLLSTLSTFAQNSNADILGHWKLDVMRDSSGAMIDFEGGSGNPDFYKHVIVKKEKIILIHYDSKQITGTWILSDDGLFIIQLKGKTMQYKMKMENNTLVLEKDIIMQDGTIFKAFGYYKK